jgi:DnaJ-class molecular chaperone
MTRSKPKDYYKILGIAYTATDQEIKSAYRLLARKYHPDVNQGNKVSEEKFKAISEAYSVLTDEKQRYLLDLALGVKKLESETRTTRTNAANKTKQAASSATKTKKPTKSTSKTSKSTKDDGIASAFSSLFESILKSGEAEQQKPKGSPRFTTDTPKEKKESATYSEIHRKAKSGSKVQRGEDISLEVFLTIDEAKKGTVKTVNLLHTDPCPKCNSAGILAGSQCRSCKGEGLKTSHEKLDVKFPASIKSGSKLRIAKQGNRGINGGDSGDLYLDIKVYNPGSFEFDGYDVMSEVAVAPHEAVLGAEVQVLTIDGFVKMKIPAGTQVAQKFRLLKQGLPDKNGLRGNHFVKVKIDIPDSISDKEKELYEEIARISKFNPREYIQ